MSKNHTWNQGCARLRSLLAWLGLSVLSAPVFAQMPNLNQMSVPQVSAAASVPVAAPQPLGPKAPGKIRIGVAPAQAQVGQGNNAQGDYGTPIRNSIVLIMGGPAVEVIALDSHLPIQVQAEAQQKQCDFILYSAVEVKHASSSGFGSFMKKAAPLTNMTPVGMIANAGSMAAKAQAAAAAASTAASAISAQQQAANQLSQFNGQIKSKDDVTIGYQLIPAGQDKAKLENTLKGKAKTDGEDVLTPLIQQAATTILTEVTKK
jgi:hypothetical protein